MSYPRSSSDNLFPQLRKALVSLQNNKELIIKSADKGGKLVVMDRRNYEQMCLHILHNREWYKPISQTVIESYCREYGNIITKALSRNVIDKQTWTYLNTQEPKVLTFYALPKVHKSLTNPSGRPIISGCGCLTENASSLIDTYLGPHVKSLFLFVQDMIDLIKLIEGISVPKDAWLVTLDVESLYNTIPHKLALRVVAEHLQERGHTADHYNEFI